jgi:DNA-binding response OmpR family regulator
MILWISENPEMDSWLVAHLARTGLEIKPLTPSALPSVFEMYPDLIVLFLRTPETDEADVVRRLRGETPVPILFLTLASSESYALGLYQFGVDDVIGMPISPELLAAKIQAWLRHGDSGHFDPWVTAEVAEFRLEPRHRHLARRDGAVVHLTPTEFRLLHYLMRRPGRELATEDIVARLWGDTSGNSVVKTVVHRLRRKIEADPKQPRYIQTTPGGYAFIP